LLNQLHVADTVFGEETKGALNQWNVQLSANAGNIFCREHVNTIAGVA